MFIYEFTIFIVEAHLSSSVTTLCVLVIAIVFGDLACVDANHFISITGSASWLSVDVIIKFNVRVTFAFGYVIQIDLSLFVTWGFNHILFSFITWFIVIFVTLTSVFLVNPSLFTFIVSKTR